MTSELPIAKGTSVYLGLAAANRSTAIWGPDATEYKPERWMHNLGHESLAENTKLPGIYSNM
jgi:cytochrome P450